MENKLSILIADENKDCVDKLKTALSDNAHIKSVQIAKDGEETLSMISNENFDVVIMDVILAGIDGFAVIEKAKQLDNKSKFIVVTSLSSDAFIQKAMSLGVEYYMIKPVSEEVVIKRIIDLYEISDSNKESPVKEIKAIKNEQSKISKNKLLEEKITNIFITVGIPAHIKGYYFLREAIKMAIENPEIINSITKQLYPSIAERFETSASKVERAIRHAIEVAWNRGKIENINSVFGVKVYSNNEKPTNGEFIALVADKMLIEG